MVKQLHEWCFSMSILGPSRKKKVDQIFLDQNKLTPTVGPPENGKRDPYHGTHIFRDSNMGVGSGNSMGPASHFWGSHCWGSRVNHP